MDADAQQLHRNKDAQMSKGLRRALAVVSCLLLGFGNSGGPLVTRLYFLHGGHRQWLPSWLETGGFPLLLLPLSISYLYRRRLVAPGRHPTKVFFLTPRLFLACAALGLLIGVDDFIYAYGLSFLPVSTVVLIVSTQLVFTALFAFLLVKQRLTPYSINSVALLTVGAVVLGLHTSSDRPDNVTQGQYLMGFFLSVGTAALYGLILPLIEMTYRKAKQTITYTLVMEMQLVMGFFATAFCTVGMLVNNDFEAIPREARQYGLGEFKYYVVLVWNAIFWQCFYIGAVGVIFCVHTLFAGIIIAVHIPLIELFGVIFFNEKFTPEKGVALVLYIWGLVSYSYGEYRDSKEKKEAALEAQNNRPVTSC